MSIISMCVNVALAELEYLGGHKTTEFETSNTAVFTVASFKC